MITRLDSHKQVEESKSDVIPGITRGEPFSISMPHNSIPLLHSKMRYSKDSDRILTAKSTHASDSVPATVMFGRLLLKLKSPYPSFDELLTSKYSSTVRASLVSLLEPCSREVVSDYLQFEDGENVSHLEVSMDYRLESSEARKAFKALFRNSAKAFLTYEYHGEGDDPDVFLELWAMEKLCEFQDPSEVAKKTSLGSQCNNLVEALYPEMVAEQQESLMSAGESHVIQPTCTCTCVKS